MGTTTATSKPTAMARHCPANHWPHLRFRVVESGQERRLCFGHALTHPRMLRLSIPTAFVVGTILTGINQGTVLADGAFPAELAWKIPLTYVVPFLVSSWGALRVSYLASRDQAQ